MSTSLTMEWVTARYRMPMPIIRMMAGAAVCDAVVAGLDQGVHGLGEALGGEHQDPDDAGHEGGADRHP